ncbi:prepilin peptidase [Opitutales bacterium]|jgi:leader peptidase (prepilin peptidase)/N-methyltransferase|nr:prepilin peptidase [Opitutales bacterium]
MDSLLLEPNLIVWLGLFAGACLGSFLNVVVYRVPRDLSVVRPASRCPHCTARIPWSQNLPILGWLYLKGRAKCCGKKILLRYFLVELFTGLMFAWACYSFIQDQEMGILIASCIFAWLMIGVVAVDSETMLIPDRFSLGGACVGFVLSMYFPSLHGIIHHPMGMEKMLGAFQSLLGILIGSGLLYWIGALASRAFGREALGEGDVKLLGCVGAFCGWKGAVFSIFGGAMIGCAFLLLVFLFQKIRPTESLLKDSLGFGVEIPFGPYLALAGMSYFFGLRTWVDPWFNWIDAISS